MSYQLNYIDKVPVVGLDGDLSRRNFRWVDDMIYSIFKSGQQNVILNFENVHHVDFKFVQHLSKRIKELKDVGGGVALAAANHYVKCIFEAMGWNEELYPTVGEALLGFIDEAAVRPWQ